MAQLTAQSCPWVHFVWPNPTRQLTDSTQPTTSGKFGPNPTQPNTTNNGAYSLVVTYFYTHNLSYTFKQAYVRMFFSIFAVVDPTQPNPIHQKLKNLDPTRPNPTQPNPWVNPTHGKLCGSAARLVSMKQTDI